MKRGKWVQVHKVHQKTCTVYVTLHGEMTHRALKSETKLFKRKF